MKLCPPVERHPQRNAADPEVEHLADARPGHRVVVTGVLGDDPLADRLRASGLWDGSVVEMLGQAPFGDPILFRLHGFRLALRRSEAQRIRVRAEGAP